MNEKVLVRGAAYLVVAVALLATTVALSNRQYPQLGAVQVQPATSTDSLDAVLARCRALGVEAANDVACKAAWRANRERFLNSKSFSQDGVTDPVPTASHPNRSAPVLGEQLPRSAPAMAKRAGQRQ
jgi:conjugative transfer region protein TrbK